MLLHPAARAVAGPALPGGRLDGRASCLGGSLHSGRRALVLWRKRREHRRTNRYGVPEYGSFRQKVQAEAFDGLLLGLGYLGMGTGAAMLVFLDNSLLSWLVLVVLIVMMQGRRCRGEKP